MGELDQSKEQNGSDVIHLSIHFQLCVNIMGTAFITSSLNRS